MWPRREFVATAAAMAVASPRLVAQEKGRPIVKVDVADGAALQNELNARAGEEVVVRIGRPREIVCEVREERVGEELSRHALLVPENVTLDLNGATLLLDCRQNGYGTRLSNGSTIREGTIRIVRSENKGLQSCWHSGVSVGAAYGDGGTTAKPGRFSTVRDWTIENITIDQPFAAAAIQLMSEACHGVIRGVVIADSAKCLLGVGMDWGSVGPITSEDRQIPRMRELWERGEIWSTHPHDVLVERLRVGRLTRNVDANDAGVRCSACHNVVIRDVEIAEAATAVAIWGGDLGYEFAREDQREFQHVGYHVENVRIDKATIFGVVLNGAADNVHRARRDHGYKPVRDPLHPGLDQPVLKNLSLVGGGERANRQGVYAVAVTDGLFDMATIDGFGIGVHVEDWVRGLTFRDVKLKDNARDKQIEGATEPAERVVFESR